MNMTYQSGWLAEETSDARYGPNSQIGLIWNRPAISATTPCLSAYRGNMRSPTTLVLVRIGPGHWVCFCLKTRPRWTLISASRMPGMSSTCAM